MAEHVEVLLGSVEHSLRLRFEQAPKRADVDRQRIDQHQLVAPSQLHQRQGREVRALAMELGVDRIAGLLHQRVDDQFEIDLLVDPDVAASRGHLGAHADPVASSRPDNDHALVPPYTLIPTRPWASRNSHTRKLRAPVLQITYVGSSPANASSRSGTLAIGTSTAPGTWASSNS